MPTDHSAYAALLDAQREANRLDPGSDEWLDATGRAQEAWAVLDQERRTANQGGQTDRREPRD